MIGVPRRRVDGEAKVRGATQYAADLPVPGVLHARLVLSTEAHARIAGIETDAARAMPGVVAVLTAADLPVSPTAPGRAGEPLAREEVLFAGQPVAMVVAESEATAADGVDAVTVDLEPLEPVLDIEAAMAPGAPLARPIAQDRGGADVAGAHASVDAGDDDAPDEDLSDNVHARLRLASGDAGAALAPDEATVSARVRTPWVYQAYLEPQAAIAWLDFDGTVVVNSATQGVFATRQSLAELLDLPLDRVRVRATPLGGAFGGKLMLPEPLAAAAALVLNRPVRVAFTRMEDFAAANPAPGELFDVEVGASGDGDLAAIRARVVCDRGMSEEYGVEGISSMLAAGPYRWGAHELRGYGVLTNRVGSGAYRGPGATPAAFALETLLDELATALGIDPVELRLRNVLVKGDPGIDGQPLAVFGAQECLERVRDHPLWRGRGDLPDGEGVGVAVGYWPGGLEPAAATCRLDADGKLTIITGAVDMSGTETTFGAIAAEAFGIDPDDVRVVAGDTASTPYAGLSGGSKVTYTVGRAVQRATEEARERLLQVAATELEIAPEDLEVVDGAVRPVGAPSRALAIDELAKKVLTFGSPYEPVEGYAGVAQTSRAPSAAAHLAHVRVDRETGAVVLVHHVIAQDVGRVLNPALVEGQLLGGTTQGLGWALYEELAHDEFGQLRTGSFVDYAIPSAGGVPAIDLEIVEVPAPDGPFGAKGIGEAPVIAAAAAVANAIHAAVGVRLRELPMTSGRVWAAMNGG